MNFLFEQKDIIVCGDCLEIAPTLPDSSIQLIISDWPYYKVKALDWDHQWKTVEEYLDWIGLVCEQYRRILAPNGSLYAFASPKIADMVSVKIREYFNVLNHIVWRKQQSRANQACKEILRRFFGASERIIFAEHYGADSAAKGESGYGAKCDELRGFVFEPLRAYLDGERRRAGLNYRACNKAIGKPVAGGGMATHYFSDPKILNHPQWALPTIEHYHALQEVFNTQSHQPAPYEDYHDAPRSRFERDHDEHEYLRAEYEDLRAEYEDLRAEYEDLRAEYEDLRRPFNVTAQDQYTDVWEFPTVKYYPGKHPCEKPLAMIEHVVKVSSRPGDLVADFFCGSGATAEAAANLGRRYFCCDIEEKWVERTKQRIGNYQLSFMEDKNGISRPL